MAPLKQTHESHSAYTDRLIRHAHGCIAEALFACEKSQPCREWLLDAQASLQDAMHGFHKLTEK